MSMTKAQRAAQVKEIVQNNPGIRASEIAERTGVSKGTISLAVKVLKEADAIEQVRDKAGRGLGLRLSAASLRRRMIRVPWR